MSDGRNDTIRYFIVQEIGFNLLEVSSNEQISSVRNNN